MSRQRILRLPFHVGLLVLALCATGIVWATPPISTVAGMPGVVNPKNLYSEAGANHFSPAVADALPRIYVPNLRSDTVSVIDPATFKVVDTFAVGRSPQHVVPAWDLRTLWVTNNAENHADGSLTPINPQTARKPSSWWSRARGWIFAMPTAWC